MMACCSAVPRRPSSTLRQEGIGGFDVSAGRRRPATPELAGGGIALLLKPAIALGSAERIQFVSRATTAKTPRKNSDDFDRGLAGSADSGSAGRDHAAAQLALLPLFPESRSGVEPVACPARPDCLGLVPPEEPGRVRSLLTSSVVPKPLIKDDFAAAFGPTDVGGGLHRLGPAPGESVNSRPGDRRRRDLAVIQRHRQSMKTTSPRASGMVWKCPR